MVTSGGVRLRQLVVVTVVVGLLGLVVLRLLGGTVPSPGWPGVVLLLFMAVGVYFAALPVKRLRERRVLSPGSALRAARSLVLAQAAALTGAGLLGWYAAQVVVLLPNVDVDSQRGRMWLLVAHAVAAIVLVVSGLLAQR
ncbi:MAG: DUF3180 domain-containing protein, partial [Dermatophilaceae bacterium]|nr:DUF3180 domain-containing protein [Dermatophilaceae bacterium]